MGTKSRVSLFAASGLLGAALVGGVAAPASAEIVIGQGMAGVSLGMTRHQVKNVLGEPRRVEHGTNDFGKFTTFFFKHRLRVLFQGNATATSIFTKGTAERTSAGVGVGSSKREVRNNVPGVTCERIAGSTTCHVGALTPGNKVTDFQIRNRHVKSVAVGIVID